MTIWESFTEFLVGIIQRFGLVKLFLALAAVVGAIVGLGVTARPIALFGAIGTIIIIVLLLTSLALIVERAKLRNTIADGAEVLNRYGEEIFSRQTVDSFDIEEWRDDQSIDKNGDTALTRTFKLIVGNQPLQTFWHRIEMSTTRSDFKYRRKLNFEARIIDPQTQVPGVSVLLTQDWEQHRVRVFLHLDRAYQPGEKLHIRLSAFWPEFTRELLENKRVDPTEWVFRRKAERLRVTMEFSKNIGIKHDFAITPLPSSQPPTQTHGRDGSHKIEFAHDNPAKDVPIGFKLQRND